MPAQQESLAVAPRSSPFGPLLRRFRLAAGFSQEQLAERAGLSVEAVSTLERGARQAPRADTVARLVSALRLGPSDQTRLEGALSLARRPTPARQLPAGAILPLPFTSFIGRERDVAEVGGMLARSRLVTLTGPGGCGKTRLALETARQLQGQYRDGVRLAELASLADPALVPQMIAAAAGLCEHPGVPLQATLVAELRPKDLLLLLDNCEHLLIACAQLVDALLQSCPELRVLTTSREALGLPGERCWPVSSLPVPGEDVDLETALQHAAVQLFVERTQVVQPQFALTAHNAAAVIQVCRRLDGIPLALELAAACSRTLSPEQLVGRLEQRFRLLVGGSRAALPRQQTLQALVDWSYDRLSEPEKRLFRLLGVFVGGFTLEAVEAVGSSDSVASTDVAPLLVRLVEQSLVVAEPAPDGAARYHLLETLRQYGIEKLLASSEAVAIQEQHAAYCLAWAEATALKCSSEGAERAVGLTLIGVEYGNLSAALRLLIERQDAARGVRLGEALEWYWFLRGHVAEAGRQWQSLLALSRTAGSARTLTRALGGAWRSSYLSQEHALANALGEEYRELSKRRGGDAQLDLRIVFDLGLGAREAGDLERAETLFEECLLRAQLLGDQAAVAYGITCLATLAHLRGNYSQAQQSHQEGLAIRRILQLPAPLAWSLQNLACLALDQANAQAARPLLEESIAIRQSLAHGPELAGSLAAYATLLALEGDADRALRLTGALEALAAHTGFHLPVMEQRTLRRGMVLARQALDEHAATGALTAGQALGLEAALALVLSTPG